jgi:hypothetical protein
MRCDLFTGRSITAQSRCSSTSLPPLIAHKGGGIMVLQQMVIDVTRGRYPVVVDHLVFELLQMRDSNFMQPPSAADMALGFISATILERGTATGMMMTMIKPFEGATG